LIQVIISMILVVNFCGENMSFDEDAWAICEYKLFPKTIETAVKLAKNKDKLEKNYIGNSVADYLTVDTDLKLLSEVTNNSQIEPDEIASLTLRWYVSPRRSEERVEREMRKDLEFWFKKLGLDFSLDDFDSDFSFDVVY